MTSLPGNSISSSPDLLQRLPLLELEHLSLLLLLASKLEMLASFDDDLIFALAIRAFQSEDDLFRGLGLLSEDGLGLTSVSLLLAVVTPFALSLERILAFFVLRYFVQSVFSAFGRGAESPTSFGNVHHFYAVEKCFYKLQIFILEIKLINNSETPLNKLKLLNYKLPPC